MKNPISIVFAMGVASTLVFFSNVTDAISAPREIRDALYAPQMVILEPGNFQMGASPGEVAREHLPEAFSGYETPQHLVTVQRSFAIGKYDVTRDQFARFVAETKRRDPESCIMRDTSHNWNASIGANWHSPGFPQSGDDPVVCVNWDDVQAYAAWLSAKTGHTYRLPTESEWEYAARAGTMTARFWDETTRNQCLYANGNDQTGKQPFQKWEGAHCSDSYIYTSPVGSFRPNSFGLYDMLGNVEQWMQDCWHSDYNGAPTDGSAWVSGDCSWRVRRGSSWVTEPGFVRAANRAAFKVSDRINYLGFRVVREVSGNVDGN